MDTPPAPDTPRPALGAKLSDEDLRAASRPTGWRRFSPVVFQKTNQGTRVLINWKTTLLAGFMLVLVGWIGGAGAAYLFVKYRRGFPEVKYTHMLFYPAMKEDYRKARGDFSVKQGMEMLAEQRYREAFYQFRVGLSLSPANREGRLMTAQFYTVWQRPDLAQAILIAGMDHHADDVEYLQTLFGFLLQRQEDFEVMRLSEELITRAGTTPALDERFRLVATARATALFFRGNYDTAEDTIRQYRLFDTVDGQLLGLRIEWERGNTESALLRLEELTVQYPDNEQVYAQYAIYLRESGRIDELRRLSLLRQLSYPDRARPRIDLLYIYDQAGNQPHLNTGISEIFRDFSGDSQVMLALADFAANTGRPELARRIYDHCKANNLPWEGPALMTVEAYVVAKRYREAIAACTEMQKENPEWGQRFASVFNGLQAIATYGLADTEAAQLFLSDFLDQSGVRSENLVAVSNRLLTLGANEPARRVLARAVSADPLNQAALTGLIRLDLAAGVVDSLPVHLRTLLAMRQPPRKLLIEAYQTLASDFFLLAPGRGALLNELRQAIDSRAASAAARPPS